MLLRKLVVSVIVEILVIVAVLFGAAGTWRWWRAWVLVGLLVAAAIKATASLYPEHKEILEERLQSPIQKGQPLIDKLLVLALFATLLGDLVLAAADVFRLHLVLGGPSFGVAVLALITSIIGWRIAYRAVVENAFAAPVVKHERRQRVVDTGVYAIVRHPMYAGAALFMLGVPLWLGSNAATLAAFVPIVVLAVRSVFEERFLVRELAGYAEYMQRVRWRLVPGVW